MSNHIHLVIRAKDNNTSDILRDFKKFTSKQILQAVQQNAKETYFLSLRDWVLAQRGDLIIILRDCFVPRKDPALPSL